MSVFVIILLILLGILLLLIEFTIIPGITIAGIGGFVLLATGVYVAFDSFGNLAGYITLLFVIIVSPILVYYFFKSKGAKKMRLSAKIDSTVDAVNTEVIKPGDTGKTIGRLAPMGKVKVNGEVAEAQSSGKFIDQNTEIRVLKVMPNKIIVEPINETL